MRSVLEAGHPRRILADGLLVGCIEARHAADYFWLSALYLEPAA
jgi:hypothetical protein